MVHFAAAGNGASSTIWYPASLPSVNAVAALDPCGNRAVFSNYGVGLDSRGVPGAATDRTGTAGYNDGVDDGGCLPAGTLGCNADADCGAGGTCILVSLDDTLFAGTSMASPYAAGVAALVLSVKPDLTVDQLVTVLRLSAVDLGDPGYDTVYGWGFVNAYAAVQLARSTREAADLRVRADPITGNMVSRHRLRIRFDIYYGPLIKFPYGWSGSTCNQHWAVFRVQSGVGSYFFVLVANASCRGLVR
jgi:subtilisin family serine protease